MPTGFWRKAKNRLNPWRRLILSANRFNRAHDEFHSHGNYSMTLPTGKKITGGRSSWKRDYIAEKPMAGAKKAHEEARSKRLDSAKAVGKMDRLFNAGIGEIKAARHEEAKSLIAKRRERTLLKTERLEQNRFARAKMEFGGKTAGQSSDRRVAEFNSSGRYSKILGTIHDYLHISPQEAKNAADEWAVEQLAGARSKRAKEILNQRAMHRKKNWRQGN